MCLSLKNMTCLKSASYYFDDAVWWWLNCRATAETNTTDKVVQRIYCLKIFFSIQFNIVFISPTLKFNAFTRELDTCDEVFSGWIIPDRMSAWMPASVCIIAMPESSNIPYLDFWVPPNNWYTSVFPNLFSFWPQKQKNALWLTVTGWMSMHHDF